MSEQWRRLNRRGDCEISSEGRVRDDGGYIIEPDLVDGHPYVNLRGFGWSAIGPLWTMMLDVFFVGNKDGVHFDYLDDDYMNVSLNNLIPKYVPPGKDEFQEMRVTILEDGTRQLSRRPVKRVKIVETGAIYNSVRECAEAIGGSNIVIYACLRGAERSHRGYTFVEV